MKSEKAKDVIERTYRARLDDVWDLWTTKEGFESWWGPQGFRADVIELDARVGGALRYDMVAANADVNAPVEGVGQPPSPPTTGRFPGGKARRRPRPPHDRRAGRPNDRRGPLPGHRRGDQPVSRRSDLLDRRALYESHVSVPKSLSVIWL